MRRTRAFTLIEAMVVLAIVGIVIAVAAMTYVSVLNTAKRGRLALQAMAATRAVIDFVLDETRRAGGSDLPPTVRVLVGKGAGQDHTDVLWLLDQTPGYATCAVVGATSTTLEFPVVSIAGIPHCCFEARAPHLSLDPVPSNVASGQPFRRTAVIADEQGRFLPTFLEGAPTASSCRLTMKPLRDIDTVVNADPLHNMPTLVGATAVLADVKRIYVDFAADNVKPPFGALFVQSEVDGDTNSFVDERQRIASNIYDFRVAVGYLVDDPAVASDPTVDDDGSSGFVSFDDAALSASSLLQTTSEARGWRGTPAPIVVGTEPPPVMLGVAVQTGVPGQSHPAPPPWSVEARTASLPVEVSSLVGRATFREKGRH